MSSPRKYRGLRVDNGEWVYGGYVEYDFNGVKFAVIVDEAVDQYLPLVKRMISIRTETVGQLAFLVDSLEFWDGDLIECDCAEEYTPWDGEGRKTTTKIRGEVKWDNTEWIIHLPTIFKVVSSGQFKYSKSASFRGDHTGGKWEMYLSNFEVIGNRHQNHELLESK